jgi:glycosyltransferase involved in cell wall biosynthesis
MPKVSVLLPVYNGERYIVQSVESILRQSYRDFELIVVNDGSTDRTGTLIKGLSDHRINLLEQENQGLTRTLNNALKVIKGEYIARQDADDLSHPDRLLRQVEFLDTRLDVGLVGSVCLCLNEDGEIIGQTPPLTDPLKLRKILRERGNPFVHGSVMFRRECIGKVGGYRIEMDRAEDYDLWLRISEYYEIAKLKEPLYLWRWSQSGISLTKMEYLEKKAELARELSEERRKEGRDSLQAGLQEEFFRQQMREDLPASKQSERKRQAYYFYRLGHTAYYGGIYPTARKNLLHSLKLNPFDLKTWIFLLLSWVKA